MAKMIAIASDEAAEAPDLDSLEIIYRDLRLSASDPLSPREEAQLTRRIAAHKDRCLDRLMRAVNAPVGDPTRPLIASARERTRLMDADACRTFLSKDVSSGLLRAYFVACGQNEAVVDFDRMFKANLRLVMRVAKRFRAYSDRVPVADRIQDGVIGLMKAIAVFDPGRGARFSTCAVHWIKNRMSRRDADTERAIRLPVHVRDQLNRLRATCRRIDGSVESELSEEAIRRAILLAAKPQTAKDVIERRVRKIMRVQKIWSDPLSLDRGFGENDGEEFALGRLLRDSAAVSPLDSVLDNERRQTLRRLVDTVLNERERTVLVLHYGLFGEDRHTQEWIARQLCITRQAVYHLDARARKKLKEYLERHGS